MHGRSRMTIDRGGGGIAVRTHDDPRKHTSPYLLLITLGSDYYSDSSSRKSVVVGESRDVLALENRATYTGTSFQTRFSPKHALTLLGPQARFGDNGGQTTWNLCGLSPKRDWTSKRVGRAHTNTHHENGGVQNLSPKHLLSPRCWKKATLELRPRVCVIVSP